jgi:hypothetical protein
MQGGNSPYGVARRWRRRSCARGVGEGFTVRRHRPARSVFGGQGGHDYSSFVVTFANEVVTGERPRVGNRRVDLPHVQEAAKAFIDELGVVSERVVRPEATPTSVAAVLEFLTAQFEVCRRGEIPALSSRPRVNLFNTLCV